MKRASPAFAAFAALAIAAGAQAATVTFQYGPADELVDAPFTHTGSLGLFDSSLGTLTGAMLLVRARYQVSHSATNTSSNSQTVEVLDRTTSSWDSSLDGLDPFITGPVGSFWGTGVLTYAPGETKDFISAPVSDGDLEDLGSVLHLLQAEGGGSFLMTCTTQASISTRHPTYGG